MQQWLAHELWGNPLEHWLIALGVALLVIVGLRVFKGVVLSRLERVAEKTETRLDDYAVETLRQTRAYFYVFVAIAAGSRIVELPERIDDVIIVAASIAVFVQMGAWVHGAVQRVVDGYRDAPDGTAGSKTMASAVGFITRVCVWTVVGLLILSNLGIEVSALVAGLGVGGIAAAFALQNVLGDLFASLSIYFDRPFDIGDFIVVGDYRGNVDAIGLRSTRISGLGGEQLVFSNGDLARARIRNYRRMAERRVDFRIGIEYNLDFAKVRRAAEILREAVEVVDGVRFDRATFAAYGEHSLLFEVVYWVLDNDYAVYMERHHEVNMEIYRRFDAEGIPFAFPTRTVHVVADDPFPHVSVENGQSTGVQPIRN